ncbi:glutamate ligase domain-containing protein [Blattabacterium punctulatus]|uniref:glutamate ligase domain-containing protein n=1 Tax=Blattabacterium punctulatus TaxID=164514 RepID=UPI001F194290|nr:cyanophycin synthetase [Blattabacterium punctulatus]
MNRYIFSEKVNSNPDIIIQYLWNKIGLRSILCIKNIKIVSPLVGDYNLYNIAASITIGIYFKISLKKIKKTIEEFIPNNNRSQILKKNNIKIIIDCYNANPSSMIKALTFFNNKIIGNKIAILGDMLELGNYSEYEHKKIIFYLEKSNINSIFLIGKIFFNTNIQTSDKIIKFFNKNIFIKQIKNISFKTDYILIKGSRKNTLESLIPFI